MTSRGKRPTRPRVKGISPKQAHFLALLQNWMGERYTGNGMSGDQASKEIDRLLAAKKRRDAKRLTRIDPERAATILAAPGAQARAAARKSGPVAMPAPKGRSDEPTPTQLHDLAVLARRVGEPVPQPADRGGAARELARLREAVPARSLAR